MATGVVAAALYAALEKNMTSSSHFPRRPPRLKTVFQGLEPFYFITFNTACRRALLADGNIHAAFMLFTRNAETRNVAAGRYVLMPDHVHLFVKMPLEGVTLARWIQSLKAYLGRALASRGHEKPYWQEGFFDHLLRSGERYSEKWNYVQQNPVRAGLVERPEDWPYQGEIVLIRHG